MTTVVACPGKICGVRSHAPGLEVRVMSCKMPGSSLFLSLSLPSSPPLDLALIFYLGCSSMLAELLHNWLTHQTSLSALLSCISALLKDALAWWSWGGGPPPVPEPVLPMAGPELPLLYNITIILGQEAGMEWLEGAETARADEPAFAHEGKHLPAV